MVSTLLTTLLGGEAKRKLSHSDLVVIPFGSIEYHGPHAPLGTDSLIAQELGNRIAARLNSMLCPLIAYTTCPITTRHNTGTLSIDPKVMSSYIENIFQGLFSNGVKGILALNAHDGNIDPIQRASDFLYPDFPDRFIININWWDCLPTPLIESLSLFSKGGGHGHGGPLETSAAWAIAFDSVDLSRAVDIEPTAFAQSGYSVLKDGGRRPIWSGYCGKISESSIEKGNQLLSLAEDRIIEMVNEWLEGGIIT